VTLSAADAAALGRCIATGGVAVIPTDTVYGLACHPEDEAAVARIYGLKGRPPSRPAAVLFCELASALEAVPELAEPELAALGALLPGPVTLLLSNPLERFSLACGPEPRCLGLRVPRLSGHLGALAQVRSPILQTSANLSGGRDPGRLEEVPLAIRAGADLVLDGGRLGGAPSSVVDLYSQRQERRWTLRRKGALGAQELERALAAAGWTRRGG
jgi:L-threonylcarbamoyladenylate synthase